MMVRALLADMSIVSFAGGVVTIACDERIRGTAENKLPELAQLMSSLSGSPVECRLAEPSVKPVRSKSAEPVVQASGEVEIDDPVVRHAIEKFRGRIVEVKPLARPSGEGTS
ncbi:MAG: hypothetical protein ACIARQ_15580 [Phycisphaerales bacterium JB061]|jgi:hypothetical protein